jgi:hypothetical protein
VSDALRHFHAAVATDPGLAQRLATHHDPALFEADALAWAKAERIGLTATDLRTPAPIAFDRLPPPAWLPASVSGNKIIWLHFAGRRPDSAFFHDDCSRARSLPMNRFFPWQTSLPTLIRDVPPRDPDGLVFHMSRCGSTLVAQMLGAPAGHVAVSEPEPVDAIVTAPGLRDEQRIVALRALASAYARDTRRCFLKLDSWHVRALPLFRAAFPDVPWIFLHREPVEVIVSHLRMRGRQTVPGVVPAAALGMPEEETGIPIADYVARVLARFAEGALEHAPLGGGLVLDYRDLPSAVFDRVLAHFGIGLSPDDRAAMEAAMGRDAKRDLEFQPDGAAKRDEADDEIHAAAARLAPLRAALLRL